jgi:hypothetical protein
MQKITLPFRAIIVSALVGVLTMSAPAVVAQVYHEGPAASLH